MEKILVAFERIRKKSQLGFLWDAYNLSLAFEQHSRSWADVYAYLTEVAERKKKEERIHGTTHEVVSHRFKKEQPHLTGLRRNVFDAFYRTLELGSNLDGLLPKPFPES